MTMETSTTAIDPVCQMEVDTKTAAGRLEHEGRTYYFCSERCLRTFQKEPSSFRTEM